MKKQIDPVDIKVAVKAGQLQAYVRKGSIYIKDTETEDTVKIGEVEEEQKCIF